MDPDLGMQPLTLKKTCDECTKSKGECLNQMLHSFWV